MHFVPTIVLISVASAAAATTLQQRSFMALGGMIEKRDVCVPVTEPVTCAKSCGAGSVQCISFPNCYNPSKGQSCCSNGRYCAAGTYCTNAGCCPNGHSLAECSATISLSVIPPPAPEPTSSAGSESTSLAPEAATSSTEVRTGSLEASTETTTSTSKVTSYATSTEVIFTSATGSPTTTEILNYSTTTKSESSISFETTYPSVPASNATVTSNTTATYSPPAQFTGAAASRVLNNNFAYFGFGALGSLLMML